MNLSPEHQTTTMNFWVISLTLFCTLIFSSLADAKRSSAAVHLMLNARRVCVFSKILIEKSVFQLLAQKQAAERQATARRNLYDRNDNRNYRERKPQLEEVCFAMIIQQ